MYDRVGKSHGWLSPTATGDRKGGCIIRLPVGLCLLLAAAACAAAQQQPGAGRTAVVLTAANLSPGGAEEQYGRILAEALNVEASNAGLRVVEPALWEQARARLGIPAGDLVFGPKAVAVARALGADLAITGSYRIEDNRIVLEVRLYDAKDDRLIASAVRSGRTGLAVTILVNDAVVDALSLVEPAAGPVPPELASRVHDLTLRSVDEGAEVLIGGRPIATVAQGRAVLPTATGGLRLTVETRKPGFQPRSQKIRVAPGAGETALGPMWPETRWAAEAVYTTGQIVGLGLGVRYYLEPDRLFVSGDSYFYLQSNFAPEASPVFHDDIRFLVGRYLFLGPYSPFRVGLAAGFGGIVTIFAERDAGDAVDLYVSPANLWLEWNTRKWAVYFRVEGKYAIEDSSDLLPRGWLQIQDMGPPMSVGLVYKWR